MLEDEDSINPLFLGYKLSEFQELSLPSLPSDEEEPDSEDSDADVDSDSSDEETSGSRLEDDPDIAEGLEFTPCIRCGNSYTPIVADGLCAECYIKSEESHSGSEDEIRHASQFILTLPYDFKIDCETQFLLDQLQKHADVYINNKQDVYDAGDWATIHLMLETLLCGFKETLDNKQRNQYFEIAKRYRTELGITRTQRLARFGSSAAPATIIAEFRQMATSYFQQHKGEYDWRSHCTKCGHEQMNRMEMPHRVYDCADPKLIWYPECLPLIKRYYSQQHREQDSTQATPLEQGYPMTSYDGGMSVGDCARLWQMSPLGVLFVIWEHSRESGEPDAPTLEELVGFSYNLDDPASLLPYLPEGYDKNESFWTDIQHFQECKKKVTENFQWRIAHSSECFYWAMCDILTFLDFLGPTFLVPEWKTWYAQKPSLLDKRAIERDGRGTGKTERVKGQIIQTAVKCVFQNRWGEESLFATGDEKHRDRVFDAVIAAVSLHPLFRLFLRQSGGRSGKGGSPYSRRRGTISFGGSEEASIFTMLFLFSGKKKTAMNVQGPHAISLLVDEMGDWEWPAEKAISQSLKKTGALYRRYFGVMVDDDMTKPIVAMTTKPEYGFVSHSYRIPSYANMYDYNLERHVELLQLLGGGDEGGFVGTIDYDGFRRQVRGLPAFTNTSGLIFNGDDVRSCANMPAQYLGKDGGVTFEQSSYFYSLSVEDFRLGAGNISQKIQVMGLNYKYLEEMRKNPEDVWFSLDYGKSAPTVLNAYLRDEDNTYGQSVWRQGLKVSMVRVPPEEQAAFVHLLAQIYKPYRIGMDCTGTDNPVFVLMTNKNDRVFGEFDYGKICYPVVFGQNGVYKYHLERPQEAVLGNLYRKRIDDALGRPLTFWEERINNSVLADMLCSDWFRSRRIRWTNNPTYWDQLIRIRKIGNKTFGVDHDIQALQVFVLMYYDLKDVYKPFLEVKEDTAPRAAIKPVVINLQQGNTGTMPTRAYFEMGMNQPFQVFGAG